MHLLNTRKTSNKKWKVSNPSRLLISIALISLVGFVLYKGFPVVFLIVRRSLPRAPFEKQEGPRFQFEDPLHVHESLGGRRGAIPKEAFQKTYIEGIVKWMAGDTKSAKAKFDEARRQNPESSKIVISQINAKLELQDYQGAIQDANQAVLGARESLEASVAYKTRCRIYLILNQLDKALADCQKALEFDAADAETWYWMGGIQDVMENYEEAIRDYTRSLTFDPSLMEVYINRGLAKKRLGLLEEALRDYTRAIKLEPNNPEISKAYSNRASVRLDKGDDKGAIKDATKAIEFDPYMRPAYMNRAAAYDYLGEFEKALEDYTQAIRLESKDPKAYLERGIVWYGRCRLQKEDKESREKAMADLEMAMRLAPENWPEKQKAKKLIEELLENKPDK